MSRGSKTLLVAVGVLALAACSTPPSSEPAGPTSSIDPRDVTSWSPSFIPTSEPLTSVEENASRLDQVSNILTIHNLPLPESAEQLPEVVREVSNADSAIVWAQCLTEQGFESTGKGGFVETTEVVPEQDDIFGQTFADCVAKYPVAAKFRQSWGADQWKVQYEYLVDFYIPCVESYGVEIDSTTIPTQATYVEAGLSQGELWHPAKEWSSDPKYSKLSDSRTAEGEQLANTCRQTAPDEKLFG